MIIKQHQRNQPKIEDYEFNQFVASSAPKDQIEDYADQMLMEHMKREEQRLRLLVQEEREHAENSGFRISAVIERQRGFKKEEEERRRRELEAYAEEKIEGVKSQYRQEGHEEGKQLAYQEALQIQRDAIAHKAKELESMIHELTTFKADILKKHKQDIYNLLRVLTKWIILRELSKDGLYVQRLVEKLILELETNENIVIRVNKNRFKGMEEIIPEVEKSLGKLKNVRVEIDYDSKSELGLIIESKKSIIDATFESQMKSLDRLFESVNIYE